MDLNDLFVSYKQVNPASFYTGVPSLPEDIYLNLERAQKVSQDKKEDMSTWRVGNPQTTSPYAWKVGVRKTPIIKQDIDGGEYTPYTGEVPRDTLDFIAFFENYEKPFGVALQEKDLVGYDLKEKGAKGHKTFGYGLLIHPETGKFMDEVKSQYSQKELEDLFVKRVSQDYNTVINWAKQNNITLTQEQVSALTSACYNFGAGFLNWDIARQILANPNDSTIFDSWSNHGKHQFEAYPGLKVRRRREANKYFGKKDWKTA